MTKTSDRQSGLWLSGTIAKSISCRRTEKHIKYKILILFDISRETPFAVMFIIYYHAYLSFNSTGIKYIPPKLKIIIGCLLILLFYSFLSAKNFKLLFELIKLLTFYHFIPFPPISIDFLYKHTIKKYVSWHDFTILTFDKQFSFLIKF